MKFDLHVHSFYSDGRYSPEKIIDLAIKRNLSGIAITDHDTIIALDRAIKYKNNNTSDFHIIPGIEFSCVYNGMDAHILGYLQEYKHPNIIQAVNFLKESRKERGIKIINKLNELGLNIQYQDVLKISNGDFIGRVPIAKALIQAGYINTVQEGFEKYLDRGMDGYVEKEGFSIDETIELIKDAGGIAVLAHPGLLDDINVLNYCIKEGIDGIEYIHSKHTEKDVIEFKKIAEENSLIQTGGSDCHGELVEGDLLLGKYFVNLDLMPKLKEMIK